MKNQFIDINELTYINHVKTDNDTKKLAMHLTKKCKTKVCEIQNILDFVTNIPYKINASIARSGKKLEYKY